MTATVDTLVAEATTLHKARDYTGAEALSRRAIAARPDTGGAHHMLGLALFEQRRHDEAKASLETAVALAPRQPEFHHNLGIVLSVRGQVQRAEGHLREAIRLKPDYAEAFYNMSSIVKLRHPDPLTDQIEALVARGGWPDTDKVFLHFAAGKLYDDLRETDRAFAHYQRGNAAKGVHYDPAATEALVRDLRQVFTPDVLSERNAQALTCGGRAVFIVGMPRSGTSLAEQILSCHSALHGAGELGDIAAIAQTLQRHAARDVPYPASAAHVGEDVFRGLGRHYLKRLSAIGGTAPRVVNKMPLDFWHLGLICCLFRHPVILHCRRDPMDTCLSCYFQNFKPGHDFSFSLEGLGHYYRMYHTIMDFWKTVLPVPIIDVSYEAVVADTEAAARRILSEMDLSWEPACATPHLSDRAVQTASWWQVRQPVYRSSTKRWEKYETHLAPLRAALESPAT